MSNQIDNAIERNNAANQQAQQQVDPAWRSLADKAKDPNADTQGIHQEKVNAERRADSVRNALDAALDSIDRPLVVGRFLWSTAEDVAHCKFVVCSQGGEQLASFTRLAEAQAIAGVINRQHEQIAELRQRIMQAIIGTRQATVDEYLTQIRVLSLRNTELEAKIRELEEETISTEVVLADLPPTTAAYVNDALGDKPLEVTADQVGESAGAASLAVEQAMTAPEDASGMEDGHPLYTLVKTDYGTYTIQMGEPSGISTEHPHIGFIAYPEEAGVLAGEFDKWLADNNFRKQAKYYKHARHIPKGWVYRQWLDRDCTVSMAEHFYQTNCELCRAVQTPSIDNRKAPGA